MPENTLFLPFPSLPFISFSFPLFQNSVEVPTQITEDILQNFQVKVKKLTTLSPVWDSQGTSSIAQVSIWASKPLRSLLTKSRVCSCFFPYLTYLTPIGFIGLTSSYRPLSTPSTDITFLFTFTFYISHLSFSRPFILPSDSCSFIYFSTLGPCLSGSLCQWRFERSP